MGKTRHGIIYVCGLNDKGKKINVFNRGNMSRDFTYIDDIVNGVVNVLKKTKKF